MVWFPFSFPPCIACATLREGCLHSALPATSFVGRRLPLSGSSFFVRGCTPKWQPTFSECVVCHSFSAPTTSPGRDGASFLGGAQISSSWRRKCVLRRAKIRSWAGSKIIRGWDSTSFVGGKQHHSWAGFGIIHGRDSTSFLGGKQHQSQPAKKWPENEGFGARHLPFWERQSPPVGGRLAVGRLWLAARCDGASPPANILKGPAPLVDVLCNHPS